MGDGGRGCADARSGGDGGDCGVKLSWKHVNALQMMEVSFPSISGRPAGIGFRRDERSLSQTESDVPKHDSKYGIAFSLVSNCSSRSL